MRLEGKTALVTAAGQGIGRETALVFAREGARVLATDINIDALAELRRAANGIETQRLDVTDAAAIAELFRVRPRFNVVFNCAGFVHQGTILDCNEADWQRSFDINVDSMYRICRAACPSMIESRGGSIINMSSVASSVRGVPNRFAYSTTKAAVIGLTKAIAADFAAYGVRCNAICPGTVRTPSLAERVAANEGDLDQVWKAYESRQPMGRLGEPKEIAALAVYLASDESAFTTGAIHVIDGGWTN
jgi:2-keto-3-deoxy-L-fuconate dehydrogenase